MYDTQTASEPDFRVVDSRLMVKVFICFAVLALLSVAIALGGKWVGHRVAMAGNTTDTTQREIVIGNNVIAVPSNTIRFAQARRDGIAQRLDLYLRYPQMDGYSEIASDAFNHANGARKTILFLSFAEQAMSHDMSGRFAPIYSKLIEKPGTPGPAGITFYDFAEKTGYLNERLAVAERPGEEPFVARCLAELEAEDSLAPCERDVLVGDGLSLTYRFPLELLGDWKALDAALAAEMRRIVRTGAEPRTPAG
ncbi:hypothetical protein [Manganibacter manganicus]|uniref:Uncharacterized protein n=1 Tax=Manganibacter manganicus TaxID=1873176 RepID=A0A1V8RTR4_9HYPH|nr:hypothetical protein [Pseudaminobacter manganicus]OQM76590.1 hypothetical protein BFN67_13220 [Pseudaminobacter manganicus]